MPRVQSVRTEILAMLRHVPFRKFVLNMENGDRVLIEHPENIGYDPDPKVGAFSVITRQVHVLSDFEAVTSVVRLDRNGAAE